MALRRFVDSHVHIWDTNLHPWYKSFPKAGDVLLGYKMPSSWKETFLWEEYQDAVRSVDLVKWVHVSAVNDTQNVEEETAWITSLAEAAGAPPYAIIGSIDYQQPLVELEKGLTRQMAHPSFRGLRLLGNVDYSATGVRTLFEVLSANKHIFDVSSSPSVMANATSSLAAYPELIKVMEHAGLPLGIDRDAVAEWRQRLAPFCDLPNSYLKLYGLGTAVHSTDHDAFRMLCDTAIEMFGVNRCMFGTNFPPDLTYGRGSELFEAFEAVLKDYTKEEADRLMVGTAEHVYRI